MNLPKFPHSAMFVGVTACGKTKFLLRLLETIYKNHFEFIVILCPAILDNKTYLSRKWIFDDKNVFIVCDLKGKLNEWIKLFKNTLTLNRPGLLESSTAGGGGFRPPCVISLFENQ